MILYRCLKWGVEEARFSSSLCKKMIRKVINNLPDMRVEGRVVSLRSAQEREKRDQRIDHATHSYVNWTSKVWRCYCRQRKLVPNFEWLTFFTTPNKRSWEVQLCHRRQVLESREGQKVIPKKNLSKTHLITTMPMLEPITHPCLPGQLLLWIWMNLYRKERFSSSCSSSPWQIQITSKQICEMLRSEIN